MNVGNTIRIVLGLFFISFSVAAMEHSKNSVTETEQYYPHLRRPRSKSLELNNVHRPYNYSNKAQYKYEIEQIKAEKDDLFREHLQCIQLNEILYFKINALQMMKRKLEEECESMLAFCTRGVDAFDKHIQKCHQVVDLLKEETKMIKNRCKKENRGEEKNSLENVDSQIKD